MAFAVVVVKPHVVQDRFKATRAIEDFTPVFGVPTILMAQDSTGRATYFGRPDIAKFMSSVPVHAIPWREYTIS
jgi:hypothetical protein